MAKVNFNNLDEAEQNTSSSGGNGSDIGFFTLRNDNDEAIVRFMCDSVDDFEILTVHDIKVGDKFRKVNCVRDPREPLDNCPLCANGTKISNRFFIKMIQYDNVQDQSTGGFRVVPKAVVWERSTAYAKTLKSYIDNYGPLSDIICKIIRHGKAGDMQTTYEIVPNLSKMVFKDEIYVKDPSLFGTFEAFGTIVMDRSIDEINHFLATGEFPVRPKADNTQSASEATPRTNDQVTQQPMPNQMPQYQQPAQQPYPTPNYQQQYAQPQFVPVQPTNTAPQGQFNQPMQPQRVGGFEPAQSSGGFDRPRRY